MDSQSKEPLKKKRSMTLIEVFILITIIAIVGRAIYWLINWREAYDSMKQIGILGTVAVFVVVFYVKKWVEK